MFEEMALAIVELERDKALSLAESRSKRGESPLQILEECRHGMSIIGERYQKGEYFLAELMLSADILREVTAILEPQLAKVRPPKPAGKIVLATLKGDIHDLGKNLFGSLVKTRGFEVYDLGVDVAPARVVEKVKEVKPNFLGFSALITTAFTCMKEATEMLDEAGLRSQFKVMVGGGVTTPTVRDYVGADFQTTDAMEGLAYCLKMTGGK
jgi:5-methyltetrahydrofolate--homocysteine methyltransferase